jgi:hypothetical protein
LSEGSPKFAFFEKVLVNSQNQEKEEVHGQIGAVLGRVQTENGAWYYTVYIYSKDVSWCLFEHELLPTGEQARREDFYDGCSLRVRVDEHGRGKIVSDEDRGGTTGDSSPNR